MHDGGGFSGGGGGGGGFDGGHSGGHVGGHVGGHSGGHDAGGGFGAGGHHRSHHRPDSGQNQAGPPGPAFGSSRGRPGYRRRPLAAGSAAWFVRLAARLAVLAFVCFVAYQVFHGMSSTP
jgi:hypothetical protein